MPKKKEFTYIGAKLYLHLYEALIDAVKTHFHDIMPLILKQPFFRGLQHRSHKKLDSVVSALLVRERRIESGMMLSDVFLLYIVSSFTVPYDLSLEGSNEPWAKSFLAHMQQRWEKCKDVWGSFNMEVRACYPQAIAL